MSKEIINFGFDKDTLNKFNYIKDFLQSNSRILCKCNKPCYDFDWGNQRGYFCGYFICSFGPAPTGCGFFKWKDGTLGHGQLFKKIG
jgi:hypothetical protein